MAHFAGLNKCEKYSYSTCSGTYSYIVHELICLTAFMKSVCVCSLSHVCLFAIPETVACQAPLSMRFSRQDHQRRLPFPSPGDIPDPGIKPMPPAL